MERPDPDPEPGNLPIACPTLDGFDDPIDEPDFMHVRLLRGPTLSHLAHAEIASDVGPSDDQTENHDDHDDRHQNHQDLHRSPFFVTAAYMDRMRR